MLPRREPTVVVIPELGQVQVGHITYGTSQELSTRVDDVSEPEKASFYANRLLSILLVEPEITPEQAADLSDAVVRALLPIAATRIGVTEELTQIDAGLPPRQRLFRAHTAERQAQIRELARTVGPAIRQIHELSRTVGPAILQFDEAMKSTARILTDINIRMATAQSILPMLQVGKDISRLRSDAQLLMAFGIPQIAQLQHSLTPTLRPIALDRIYRASGLENSMIHTPTFPGTRATRTETADAAERRRAQADYDVLFRVEGQLRIFIASQLEEKRGRDWWRQAVPEKVRTGCEERRTKREPAGGVSGHPIEFAWVDDYRAIVLRADNWRDCFNAVFGNRLETEVSFLWIGRARTDIGHSRPLDETTRAEFLVAANRILRAITGSL